LSAGLVAAAHHCVERCAQLSRLDRRAGGSLDLQNIPARPAELFAFGSQRFEGLRKIVRPAFCFARAEPSASRHFCCRERIAVIGLVVELSAGEWLARRISKRRKFASVEAASGDRLCRQSSSNGRVWGVGRGDGLRSEGWSGLWRCRLRGSYWRGRPATETARELVGCLPDVAVRHTRGQCSHGDRFAHVVFTDNRAAGSLP
jgi:hypothetical protein